MIKKCQLFVFWLLLTQLLPAQTNWEAFVPLNTARTGASAVVLDGAIYVISGQTNNNQFLTSVEVLDNERSEWEDASVTEIGIPRINAAAVAYNGEIYVIGGRSGSSTLSSVEIYNPLSNAWRSADSLNDAREGHAAIIINNKICVFGGVKDDNDYPLTIEIYDESSDDWFLSPSEIIQPRALIFAGTIQNRIYMFGGVNVFPRRNGYSATVDGAWNFNWTEISSLQKSRGYGASVVLDDQRIMMLGGYTLTDTTDRVEVFNPSIPSLVDSTALLAPRLGLNTVAIGDTIFAIGGSSAGENRPLSTVDILKPTPVSLEPPEHYLPDDFAIVRGYPNPFNGQIQLQIRLPERAAIHFAVYDIHGRKVATLARETLPAGEHSYFWNGNSQHGDAVASGIYFAVLNNGIQARHFKMIYIR